MGGANFQQLPDRVASWYQEKREKHRASIGPENRRTSQSLTATHWKPVWANVRRAVHTSIHGSLIWGAK